MTDLQSRIAARLRELHGEIERLERAREALTTDGSEPRQPARGRPGAPSRSRSRGRRSRQTRMDARERESQTLHRIRQHG